MAYLKQDEVKRAKLKKPTSKKQEAPTKSEPVHVVVTGPDVPGYVPTPSLQHDINHVTGLAGIEESLDWIKRGISHLTSDEHCIHLTTGFGTSPVKLTLADNDEDNAMDRFLSAMERIADSLARLAGLSRPRLERWYEQDEYEPRYKDVACDGGAPGPAEANNTKRSTGE